MPEGDDGFPRLDHRYVLVEWPEDSDYPVVSYDAASAYEAQGLLRAALRYLDASETDIPITESD